MTRNEGEFTYNDLVELEKRVADLEAWRLRIIEAAQQTASDYLHEHRDVMADMRDTPLFKFYEAFFK